MQAGRVANRDGWKRRYLFHVNDSSTRIVQLNCERLDQHRVSTFSLSECIPGCLIVCAAAKVTVKVSLGYNSFTCWYMRMAHAACSLCDWLAESARVAARSEHAPQGQMPLSLQTRPSSPVVRSHLTPLGPRCVTTSPPVT